LSSRWGDLSLAVTREKSLQPFSGEEAEAHSLAARIPALLIESQRIAHTVAHGTHGRRRAGPGETFWQFRHYDQNDSVTGIDWRRSASSDTLFVREREWEAAHTVWLWVDLSASMRFRSRATCTVSGTSSLDPASRSQLDLRLFGDRGHLSLDFDREQLVIQEVGAASPIVKTWPGAGAYACDRPVQFFVDLCRGRPGRNLASGEIGRRSSEVLDAMYRSAVSGRLEPV